MLDARYQITTRFNKSLNYKNLDSFRVKRVIDNCVYKLKLSNAMQDIYSVFHSWLLHIDDNVSLQSQRESNAQFAFIDKKREVWYIDEILDFKIDKRRKNSIIEKLEECLKYKIK